MFRLLSHQLLVYNGNHNTNDDWRNLILDEYTLYLDESVTHKNGLNQAFAIGGFIVKDSDIKKVDASINDLKNIIWSDIENNSSIILHEKDLKDAITHRVKESDLKQEYKRFRRNKNNVENLYKKMSEIIDSLPIYTIGCVVIKDNYDNGFPTMIGNEISLVCMQIILENLTHFLFSNGASGKIVYESRDSQDKNMLMRFYQVSTIGTMYVKPEAIQNRVKQLIFISKKDNVPGLQLADFIPNQIARKMSKKNINKNVINLTQVILEKAYSGYGNNKTRYGIKIVPRLE